MQTAVFLWLVAAVCFNCLGWLLTAARCLNPTSYAVALGMLGIGAGIFLKKNWSRFVLQKIWRRGRRPLAAVFFVVAGLVIFSGCLYPPTNYDALTYRLPRVLNWLNAEKWFWIPTTNTRMNFSGLAWEWTALPLLAVLKSDRLLFLINGLGFLLMPGLLFSIFRRLGIAGRVAWNWMWVLPLAYGYVTQAGSIGNDLTGTLFFLCSIFFGLEARRSGRASDVWLAIWAAALLSSTKLSNLPLSLPCLLAVAPALKHLRKSIPRSLVAWGIALLISAAPIMILNQRYSGHWAGDPENKAQVQVANPVAALLGNSILLAEQTFMPPVLPAAQKINQQLINRLPPAGDQLLRQQFPRFYLNKLNELPTEESAGLGLGITLALLVGVGATLLRFSRGSIDWGCLRLHPIVLAGGIALLFYLLKTGSESTARLLLPYYPLCVAALLKFPGHQHIVRQRLCHAFLVLMSLSVLPAIILSAARPLWPGQTVCQQLRDHRPGSSLWERMAAVYITYAERNDALGPVRKYLPPAVREIGVIVGSNNSTYALWRPFGQRKVTDLRYADRFLSHPGDIEWVVVKDKEWAEICPVPLHLWAQTNHATIVASVPIVELVSWGPQNWTVLHFKKN
jgi:hypothetical protein